MSDRERRVAALQARLARRYAAVLPDRIADLRAALRTARRDPDALEPARELAHRLKGTIGSYGFARVAEGVATIEGALRAAEPPDWTAIEEALAEVERRAAALGGA